ncbi:MAG: hypothetical protein HYX67_11930 [Candidatus Melainabacteria bacterium]|nr:hypothetical protein [Candidatus Melainabacteria bacterium]
MTFVRDLDARVKTLESVMADDIARGPVPSNAPKPHIAPQSRPVSAPASQPEHRSAPQPEHRAAPQPEHRSVPQPEHRSAPQPEHRAPAQPEHRTAPSHNPTQVPVAAPAAAEVRPAQEAPPRTVAPKVERPAETAPQMAAKAPAPTSSFASKLNEAMASAGLGSGPSTSTFKSSGGEPGRSAAFPQSLSKIPPEVPPEDSSYDDVEPDQPGKVATPVLRPPVVEPTLEALEAQGDVVEEIDDYEIVPRSLSAPDEGPLPLSAPPLDNVPPPSSNGSSDEEEEEDDDEQPEPPIEADDDDDAGIPPAPLVVEDPAARSTLASTPASAAAPAAAPASTPASTPSPAQASEPDSAPASVSRGGGEDIDQFWSEVREALQKRHLPTFSIVSVHAFPVSLESSDFVIGVRNETFQKQLDNKIEHLKAACAAATGRTINVRIKVVADNAPKPAVGAAKVAARPKETRSAESPEGESRTPNSPSPSRPPTTPAMNTAPQSSAPAQADPSGHGAVRTTQMSEIEQRIGGNLINEAYKLFEGPGSRLIG